MPCTINTANFLPVVETLIKLDPEKYSQFDEAARFVLQAPRTPEQRALTIGHLAHIYQQLEGLQPARYQGGQLTRVLELENLLDSPLEYLSQVEAALPLRVQKPVRLTAEHVQQALDKAQEASPLVGTDVQQVLQAIDEYVSANRDLLPQAAQVAQATAPFYAGLREVIARQQPETTETFFTEFLQRLVEDHEQKYQKATSYLALAELLPELGLDSYLGVRLDGSRVELIAESQDGAPSYYQEIDGQRVSVPLSELLGPPQLSLPVGKGMHNTGQNVFLSSELGSALVARALNPTQQEELDKKLQAMGSQLNAQIQIKAVRLEEFTDERQQRLQQAALENPELEALRNRRHETFENQAQIKRLQTDPAAEVLTVRRPTKSEDEYTLMGVLPDGRAFMLYAPSQFAVVSADNSTRRVDLRQPADLQTVRELSVVRYQTSPFTYVDSALTQQDAQRLSQSMDLFDQLDARVKQQLQASPEREVDITDLFRQTYQFSREKPQQTLVPLDQFVSYKGEDVARELTIVKLDASGNINPDVASEQRMLPFVYYRYADRDFQPAAMLSEGERILHEGFLYTYADYAKDVLGIDHQVLIEKFLSQAQQPHIWSLMIYFTKDQLNPHKFMIVEQRRPTEQVADFAGFLGRLNELRRSDKNTNEGWQNFGQQEFSFRSSGKGMTLNFNARQKPNHPRHGEIILELRGNDKKNPLYGALAEGRVNFPLNQDRLDKILQELQTSPLIQDLKSRFTSLSELDPAASTEQLTRFYRQASALLTHRDDELAERLTEMGARLELELGSIIKTDVFDNFEARLKEADVRKPGLKLHQRVMAAFQRDATGTHESYLIGLEYLPQPKDAPADSRQYVPKISYAAGNTNARRLDQYFAVTAPPRTGVRVLPVSTAHQAPATQPQPVAQPPAAAPVQPTPTPAVEPAAAPVDKTDRAARRAAARSVMGNLKQNTDDASLSLQDRILQPVSQPELRFQEENLRRMLPQFQISEEDVRDVLHLQRYDGRVSGAFLDKIIYLNRQLAESGTVYHEGFHGVFRYLLSSAQRQDLVKGIQADKRYKHLFSQAALREFARKRGQIFNSQTANRQAEEILADGFRDYVLQNKKPARSVWKKLFDLLKNLLNLAQYRREQRREQLFSDINNGFYSSKVIQESGEEFQGEVALELIPGIEEVILNPETGEEMANRVQMSIGEQRELINKLVHDIVNDDNEGKLSFDQLFELHRENLYRTRFNVEHWIDPKMPQDVQQRIRQTYTRQFQNYQFILGRALDLDDLDIINSTPNEQYSGQPVTDMGEEALASLKKMVRHEYDALHLREYITDLAKEDPTQSTAVAVMDGAVRQETEQEQAVREETPNDSEFDKGFNEHDRMAGLSSIMRQFFGLVEYNTLDQRTGLWMPQMVDGQQIFNTIMKITSDKQPEHIIHTLKETVTQYDEDGYFDDARALEAVYNKLKALVGLDHNNLPTQREQIYNQFIDAFHGTEIEYLVNSVVTETKPGRDGMPDTTRTRSYIKDALLKQDLLQKKLVLTSGLQQRYNEYLSQAQEQDAEYEKSLKKIQSLSRQIAASKANAPLFSGNSQKKLQEMTTELYLALKAVRFDVPKSLVRLSLHAIDQVENRSALALPAGSYELVHFTQHQEFVREGKYFQKDFFRDLDTIVTKMLGRESADSLSESVDSEQDNDVANRYNAVLTRASHYLVKYDPAQTQSTVKNGEGKTVYRYVKYTPAVTIAQDIRQHERGLKGHFEQDPFFKQYLEKFYGDNPLLKLAMSDELTAEAAEARLFFKNLKIAAWGGLRQTLDGKQREGVTFSGVDDHGLLLNSINYFLQRNVLKQTVDVLDAQGNRTTKEVEITTFNRMLTQLEASSTNFLVTGRYRAHAGKHGSIKYQGKYKQIVETLEAVTRQEFNRMQREWQDKDARAQALKDGTNRILNNFNGKWKDGQVTTSDKSLRAYNFRLLPDFFGGQLGKSLGEELQREALEKNQSFEAVMKTDLGERLRSALDTYAQEQLDKHLDNLERAGVIQVSRENQYVMDGHLPLELDWDDSVHLSVVENGVRYALASTEKLKKYASVDIPEFIGVEGQKGIKLTDQYGPATNGQHLRNLLEDNFFNFFENSLLVNQVFDGDVAMTVKNAVDYFKRNKGLLAAGSTMKRGLHSVAIVNTIWTVLDPDNLEVGQFDSLDDMQRAIADTRHHDPERADMLQRSYDNILGNYYNFQNEKGEFSKRGEIYAKVFDGMSFSLHMHQMDMHESLGRLGNGRINGKVVSFADLLIAKTYRSLTKQEIQLLESGGVVHNSKKTVTASRLQYHKQSEHLLDRGDVSHLKTTLLPGQKGYQQEVEQKHRELHQLQWQIYNLRQQRNQLHADNMSSIYAVPDPSQLGESMDLFAQIQELVKQTHDYFEPKRARQKLHDILNAMEYHQVDQLMDTEASKKLSILPVDVSQREGKYLSLDKARNMVDNRFKYLQVETSGVHEEVKMGVQAKVLLAADIKQLADRIAQDDTFSESEKASALELNEILGRYQSTLTSLTESKLQKLQKFLRDEDGNFDVADVFTMIRESLLEQGADSNKLKWFELTPDGKPANGTNMPQVRKMLEYYFFSIYSNNVTDEKGAGFKAFHVTSYGYQLLYDKYTGKVIPQSQVDKNPRAYNDPRRYGTRYPGVKKTQNAQGQNVYFVEVLMARPDFDNPQHEQFWRQHVSQMFGTRIPTEDKRSMVALEVVDFIDASYRNTIIVPQLIHQLSGSDLDIDSLYGQKFAIYREWMRNKQQFDSQGRVLNQESSYRKYGDYGQTEGKNRQVRQFTEYFTHITSVGDIAGEIRRQQTLLAESEEPQPFSAETREILAMLGYDEDEIRNVELQQTPLPTTGLLEHLKQSGDELEQQLESIFVGDRQALLATEGFSEEEIRLITDDFVMSAEFDAEDEDRLKRARYAFNSAKNRFQLYRMAGRIEASVRALRSTSQLPVTLDEFVTSPAAELITPAHQNRNLQAKLDLMSNEAVYKNIYISEQQSTERFKRVMKWLGISAEDIANRYNPYTVDGVVNVRSLNSMNKDGIAITANLNKFLSVASTNELLLKPEQVLWNINGRSFDTFGANDSEGVRAIALIGNMLGIFADGAKDPIPGALKMNEVNTTTTLAMIGLGIDAEAAIFLNFFKEIRSAVKRVQDAQKAVSTEYESDRKQLHSEIGDVLYEEFFRRNGKESADHVEALKELDKAGVLQEHKNTIRNFRVDAQKVLIKFKLPQQKFDVNNPQVLDNLLPEQMGYDIQAQDGTKLSQLAQKIILLDLYRQQSQQTNKLKEVSRLVGLFKRLNPSFVPTDSLIAAVKSLESDESVFTNSSKLFAPGQVWGVLRRMLDDLDAQSQRLFLERTEAFAPIYQLIAPLYQDKSKMTADVVSFVGLHMFRKLHNQGKTSANAEADTQNMLAFTHTEMFVGLSPNPGVVTTLEEDLTFLRERYPRMKLLSYYRLRETKVGDREPGVQILRADGTPVLKPNGGKRGEIYLEQMNKGKTSGEFAEALIDDHFTLLRDPDPKVKRIAQKLVYHEIFRTGLQDKPGSALKSLDNRLLRDIAQHVERFSQTLYQSTGNGEKLVDQLQELLGAGSQNELHQVLEQMMDQVTYSAVKSSQKAGIPRVRNLKLDLGGKTESMVVRAATGPNATARAQVLTDSVNHFFGGTRSKLRDYEQILQTAKPGEKLVINTYGNNPAVSQNVLDALSHGFGLRGSEEGYSFPFVLKSDNGKKAFRLKAVDGQELIQLMTEAMTKPIELDESGKPVTTFLVGHQAVYEAMSEGMGSEVVSPLGLPVHEAERYHRVIKGEEAIVLPEPGVLEVDPALVGTAPAAAKSLATTPVSVTPKGSQNTYSVFRDESGLLHIQDGAGQEVASGSPAYRSIVTAYKEVYLEEFRKGKTVQEQQVDNEHQYFELVATESENPREVAAAWASMPAPELTPTEQTIKENLRTIAEDSFLRWSDKNHLTAQIGRSYLGFRSGNDLDTQAEEMGVEIQDILDFIYQYPAGAASAVAQESGLKKDLQERFQQLTGLTLDEQFASRLMGVEERSAAGVSGSSVLAQMRAGKLRQELALAPKNDVLELGRYVKLMGEDGQTRDFVIIDQAGEGHWKLRDPRSGQVLPRVKASTLVPTKHKGQRIFYAGKAFLVLPSKVILPLEKTSHDKWNEEGNGDRRGLLELWDAVNNLDLASDRVARHFYELSTKRLSFEKFQPLAQATVASLLGATRDGKVLSREDVADQLSCL